MAHAGQTAPLMNMTHAQTVIVFSILAVKLLRLPGFFFLSLSLFILKIHSGFGTALPPSEASWPRLQKQVFHVAVMEVWARR